MKVAFISTPNFADCDIPLINALQKKVDLVQNGNNNNKPYWITHTK